MQLLIYLACAVANSVVIVLLVSGVVGVTSVVSVIAITGKAVLAALEWTLHSQTSRIEADEDEIGLKEDEQMWFILGKARWSSAKRMN